jgi:hypothetical protein
MLGAKCNELGRDDARSEPVSEPLSEPTAPGLGEPCRSPNTIATKSSMAFLSLFPGEAVPLAYNTAQRRSIHDYHLGFIF